jgi:seryl-tRNA synthetase
MSDSILDKIRSNRKRTIVPNREDTLIAPKQESEQIAQRSTPANETSNETSNKTSANKTSNETSNKTSANETSNETTNSNSTLEELKAELAKIPPTRRHSAVVLDAEIDANLTRFCKEKGVTVEVFLEAAWLQAVASSELMEKILVEAKCRYDSRKLAGKLRRLITMLSGR